MTTNTMVAIQTITASSQSAVSFTSIPSTYTDLHIVAVGTSSTAGSSVNYWRMTFNGDSSSGLYSDTYLYGNGSSAASSRDTGGNVMYLGYVGQTSNTAQPISTFDIMNYANSTTYKTVLARGSAASDNVGAMVGLWRNINAINRVDLFMSSATVSGTFTLYGIANADIGAYATGGIITQDATYYYHAFGSSGTFTPKQNLTCDYLVIAGGGGGGEFAGGGGGAGGLRSTVGYTGGGGSLESAVTFNSGTAYTMTVGAGGVGSNDSVAPTNGGNSSIAGSGLTTITSLGGGYGGDNSWYSHGNTGGSGGGTYGNGGSGNQGSGTINQGYAGGSTPLSASGTYVGTGGGGAGQAGQNAVSSTVAGNGGNGVYIPAFATTTGTGINGYYAGGGGGGTAGTVTSQRYGGSGGLGGGGAGQNSIGGGGSTNGAAGIANTGGGGGGPGFPNNNSSATYGGGAGGSGVIIVRYLK